MSDSPVHLGSCDGDGDEGDEEVVVKIKNGEEGEAPLSPGSGSVSSVDWDEIDTTVVLPSGKEYAVPSSIGEISFEDFALLGEAPWFDLEALKADIFIHQYSVDGWLPGRIL